MPATPRRIAPKPLPTTTVLLVRHGRTPTTGKHLPGQAPGLHLSDHGRAQADRVAERIAAMPHPPVAVYASPLERARETAAPIARALGLRVRRERDLIDLDIGSWEGMSLARAARRREWAIVQRWPSGFRFPGGESFAELSARAGDAVLRLVAAHRGETVVAVSHADPIRSILAVAAGVPVDLFQRLTVAPCSVSAIAYGPAGPRVLCMNVSTDQLVAA